MNYIVLLLHWISHLKMSHRLTIVFCSLKKNKQKKKTKQNNVCSQVSRNTKNVSLQLRFKTMQLNCDAKSNLLAVQC